MRFPPFYRAWEKRDSDEGWGRNLWHYQEGGEGGKK